MKQDINKEKEKIFKKLEENREELYKNAKNK